MYKHLHTMAELIDLCQSCHDIAAEYWFLVPLGGSPYSFTDDSFGTKDCFCTVVRGSWQVVYVFSDMVMPR
jgi:hypothetical protein